MNHFAILRYLIAKKTYLFFLFLLIFLNSFAQLAAEESQMTEFSEYNIPTAPVRGIIAGKQFTAEDVKIDGNELVLRQGSEFFADLLLSVSFSGIEKGTVPAGWTFSYSGPKIFESPAVLLQWREEGKPLPESHWVQGAYTVHVEFGQEKKRGWLPGRIYIKISENPGAEVAGEFNAIIKGLRLINGVPDIKSDSPETLEYVALKYLEQRFPGTLVKINDSKDVIHEYRPKDPYRKDFTYYYEDQEKYGRMALRYAVGGEDRGWTKLKFKKNAEGWAVDYEMAPYRLFAAHDHPDKDGMTIIQYLVARYIEDELISNDKPTFIHGVFLMPSYGRFFGEVTIRYHLGDNGEKFERRFLLVPSEDSWQVERELAPDEVVDNRTGKITRRK